MAIQRSIYTLPFLLQYQLSADKRADLNLLSERDRLIGKDLGKLNQVQKIWSWLERLSSEEKGSKPDSSPDSLELSLHSYQDSLLTTKALLSLFLAIVGLLLGLGSIFALCQYDGSQPVNIVYLLGCLLGIQFFSLLIFILSFLPSRSIKWLESLQLAYLLSRVLFFLPGPWRKYKSEKMSNFRMSSRLLRSATILFSQFFGFFFFLGAVIGFFILVTFSDLAFAWSSTLNISARSVYNICSVLSAPWSGWLPVATPSLDLIETSRFYRLSSGVVQEPEVYGAWWQFVAMCLVAYGVLPKLAMLGLASIYHRRRSRIVSLRLPGVADLLDRMNNELVSLSGERKKDPSSASLESAELSIQTLRLPRDYVLMNWSNASNDPRALLGSKAPEPRAILQVGGLQSTAEDVALIKELKSDSEVILLVKSWEPPNAELFDFTEILRSNLRSSASIKVVPVSYNHKPVRAAHMRAWKSAVANRPEQMLSLNSLEAA